MTHVKLKGYGTFKDCSRIAKIVRETKTMIVVEWGKRSKRFSKKTGHAVGDTERWSGWRIDKDNNHAIGENNGLH